MGGALAEDGDSTLSRALGDGSPPPDVGEDLARARLRDRLFGESAGPVKIGRYTVLHTIGRGGNGVVYAAYDDRLDRKIALKVLRSDSGSHPKRARARLLQEAQALARLAHPNIVTVFEVFEADDRDVVIAMEFVDGEDLGTWTAASKRPWTEIVAKYRDAARGLAAAHEAGMVHRDFKPGNAVVGPDGRVRVLDFGLVRTGVDSTGDASGPPRDGGSGRASLGCSGGSLAVTLSGSGEDGGLQTGVVGTPLYMPPEQHRGPTDDVRSDQYSFCVALWEVLMGTPPFDGKTMEALYHQKAARELVDKPEHDVPARIVDAVERGLAPDPADRHPSMDALVQALRFDPHSRRRRIVTVGAVTAAAVAGAGYGALAPDAPCSDVGAAVHEVWTPSRIEAIGVAFEATGKTYADPSWQTTRAVVDAWTSDWIEARTDACLAHDRGEQSAELLDLRTACLDDDLALLEALLGVFEAADEDVVAKAVSAARKLPPLSRCADTRALRAKVPLPSGEKAGARIDSWRTRLAQAKANNDAGRYARARALAEAVAVELEGEDAAYDPIEGEALVLLGMTLSYEGRPKEAVDAMRRGSLLAQSVGDDATFVSGAVSLVWEYGDTRSEFEVAHTWADLARSALQRAGGDETLAARLHNNLGAVLAGEQRFDEAIAEHEARLAIVGEESGDARQSLANIGNVHNMRGEYPKAAQYYERAIAVATAELGPQHPQVLYIRSNVLGILWRTRPLAEARAYGEELLATQTEALGPEHPELANTATNLAVITSMMSDVPATIRYAEQAIARLEAAYGPDSYYLIPGLQQLASTYTDLGEIDEARPIAERSLAIAIASRGPDHIDAAYAHQSLGVLARLSGDFEAALDHHLESRRITLAAGGPLGITGIAESHMASVLMEMGRFEEAEQYARSALDRFAQTQSPEADTLIARAKLGRALVDQRRYDEALVELDPTTLQALDARFDQLRARVALGHLSRVDARPRARAILDEIRPGTAPQLRARIEAWLHS